MSYFEKIKILTSDSPNVDAFGRWRVSNPQTLFDSKFIHSSSSVYWAEKSVLGATASYNAYSASVYMDVSNVSGSYLIRQTRRRFNYQPGKSHMIINTGIFGTGATGVVKRFGYFDSENGVYFIQSGSSFGVGLRTAAATGTPVDSFYSQSSWNLDTMDGKGVSGLILDESKAQIYFCDFEWLGAGRIRYGTFLGGNPYYVHEISNLNTLNGVYMSTPNLPVRYEITNYGNSNSSRLIQICSAISSEGGRESTGVGTSINTGISPVSVAVGSERVLLAWRKNALYKGTFIIPHELIVATPDTNDGRWSVWVNPTISGSMTWQDIPNIFVQYATGSTQTVSGGSLVASGYLIGGTTQAAGTETGAAIEQFQGIGFDVDNVPDTLVLTVQSIGGTNTYYAAWSAQIET